MQFIAFWEILPGDIEERRANREKSIKEMKENPEKYPRRMRLQDGTAIMFRSGSHKGFSLVEADTDDQLVNLVALGAPFVKYKFVFIQQTAGAKEGRR